MDRPRTESLFGRPLTCAWVWAVGGKRHIRYVATVPLPKFWTIPYLPLCEP